MNYITIFPESFSLGVSLYFFMNSLVKLGYNWLLFSKIPAPKEYLKPIGRKWYFNLLLVVCSWLRYSASPQQSCHERKPKPCVLICSYIIILHCNRPHNTTSHNRHPVMHSQFALLDPNGIAPKLLSRLGAFPAN